MAETADTNGSNGIAAATTPEENSFPALGPSVTNPEVEESTNRKPNGKVSLAEAWMKEEEPSAADDGTANEDESKNGNTKSNGPRVDISSGEAFPALGAAPAVKGPAPKWGPGTSPAQVKGGTPTGSAWSPAVKLNTRGQSTFELLNANRRPIGELKKAPGEIIKDVMKKTNTKIESSGRQSATIFIVTGSENDRERARKEVLRELTVKGIEKLTIPAVIRPHIIGKGGKIIGELQTKTFTNIKVPPAQPGAGPVDEHDESTIEITIEGESEGRADARRLIMAIVSERGIKVTRRVECNGEYYHFIQGPFARNIEEYEKTVDKVIVPDYFFSTKKDFDPPSAPITIIGEKAAAEQVQAKIEEQVRRVEAQHLVTTFMNVPKEKHQFFVQNKARAIHEILQETGCTVVLPTFDADKLIVLGTPEGLSKGLAAVKKKAEEFQSKTIDICKGFPKAPTGPKVHARDVTHYLSKSKVINEVQRECDVQIAFPPREVLYDLQKGCPVTIVGKERANVDNAGTKLISIFGAYTPERLAYVEVEPLHHKHIPGKDGRGVRRISDKTSVQLSFPADPEDPSIVLIYEGESKDQAEVSAALEEAKAAVEESVKGLINIVSETLQVPQEHHSKIRGENNTTLNALNPSSILITFGAPKARPGKAAPAAGSDADNTITLRGPPSNVEATKKNILTFLDSGKAQDERVTVTFDYDKEYSGNLIGTKGANINKLRDEYGVDINLNEGKGEIKGLEVTAKAAQRKLKQQVEELKDKAVLHVKVPQKFHSVIIGAEGATVKRLEDKYHVRIMFPKNGRGDASPNDATDGPVGKTQAPDEIIVRGSKKEAEEVRQEITELFKYEQENSYTATIKMTSRAQNNLFRNASKDIRALRESSMARINIPSADDAVSNDGTILEIRIRGQKEEVEHAKKVLSKLVETAEETSKRTVNVDKKFHRTLIGPGGQTLKDIVVKAGGPEDRAALAKMVRFPNQDATSTEITVEGKSSVVDNIIASIEKIIVEKESQVTVTVDVAPEKHRKLIGREGSVRKELEAQFNVSIDIPRQRQGQQSQAGVKVVGSPEAVEKAKEHILEMVKEPEGETIEVPRRLHHVVADQGQFIRQLKKDFDVTIDHNGIPRPPKPSDPKPGNAKDLPLITDDAAEAEESVSWEVVEADRNDDETTYPWVIIGKPENIAKAKVAIEKAVETAEKQSSIGLLTLPDPTKYRFVVGPGGSQVDKIRRETGCRITVPRNQASGEAIVLYGSKEGLEKAKDMIITVVKNGGGDRSPRPSRGGRGGRRGD